MRGNGRYAPAFTASPGWLRPLAVSAPWLTVILLVLMFAIVDRALTISPGVDPKGQSTGYIVSVSYWWFPIWMTARIPLKTSDGRDTTAPAIFDKEEEAKEYIVGRYNIITVENYAKKN